MVSENLRLHVLVLKVCARQDVAGQQLTKNPTPAGSAAPLPNTLRYWLVSVGPLQAHVEGLWALLPVSSQKL